MRFFSQSSLWSELSRYHLLVFIGCWLGGIFDGMDSTLMAVVLPVAVSHLSGSEDKAIISQIGSWITALFLLGWTLGGILFGWLGDRYGRVKAMAGSILLYSVFTGLAGLAQNWPELAACRFLTGLGIGGELVTIATFLTEVWPARSRAIAIGLLITSYQAGVFLAGGLHYLLHDWRITFFIGALPALLVVLIRTTLKESDRWLSVMHQPRHPQPETQKTPERGLHLETEPSGVFKTLLQPKYRRSLWVGCLLFGALLIGYWASLSWIPTWIQSLLPFESDGSHERSLATMSQAIAAIMGCSAAGILSDRFGRKLTLAVGMLGSLVASIWMFGGTTVFSSLIYLQSAALGFFIGLVQATLYIYLPELFPTRARASGTGFCLNAGRILTSAAVLVMAPLVTLLGGYGPAALAFSGVYGLGAITLLFARETRGQALLD
ncbi:MAG: MFS transporter [Vampirovibrionales bacterium]|nr:MFS transporter [Vampirovibrionales bacterium]